MATMIKVVSRHFQKQEFQSRKRRIENVTSEAEDSVTRNRVRFRFTFDEHTQKAQIMNGIHEKWGELPDIFNAADIVRICGDTFVSQNLRQVREVTSRLTDMFKTQFTDGVFVTENYSFKRQKIGADVSYVKQD